jgi:hypothetical protein
MTPHDMKEKLVQAGFGQQGRGGEDWVLAYVSIN